MPISPTPTTSAQLAAGWTHNHDNGPCDPLLHLDPAMPRPFVACPGGRCLTPCRAPCQDDGSALYEAQRAKFHATGEP